MTGKETPMSDWECSAAVNIAGEHYECTEKSPHGHSSIHTNIDGSVIWSCGEAMDLLYALAYGAGR